MSKEKKNKNKHTTYKPKTYVRLCTVLLSILIIIGIISIFYQNSKTLLIGIAISSFLLTIIQCISSGNNILNIFPIFTLLLFGFFPKTIENIPGINILIKDEYCNLIIFISFALTFFTQSLKNILYNDTILLNF